MDTTRDERGADPVIETTEAFCREFRAAVAVHAPALLDGGRAAKKFLKVWMDTLEARVLACDTGSHYGMVVVLLHELAESQIELSVRARGDRPAN
jgi:hypothetical protein